MMNIKFDEYLRQANVNSVCFLNYFIKSLVIVILLKYYIMYCVEIFTIIQCSNLNLKKIAKIFEL